MFLKHLFLGLLLSTNAFAQQSPDAIRLLVRSDDIGFSHTINRACIDAYTKGISRSVEIMVPTPWFEEAVTMLHQHRGYDVGVHLVLTSEWTNLRWRPLTQAPSLVDKDGYFPHFIWKNDRDPDSDYLRSHNINLAEVEAELRAQIELALKKIPWISHLTGHMGCEHATPEITALVDKLAAEYKLPIRMDASVKEVKGFSGAHKTPKEKIRDLVRILENLQPGTHLIIEHPGYDEGDLQAVGHLGYENVAQDRQGITEAFTNKKVKEIITRRNIQLIQVKDVGVYK